ncbi:hypothetical protein AB1Y20_005590 [Prymnesium parvum]|uniref:SURF1-like protein n=1 Tax=Prymnesium parvum TaxID=97485 RepID=A0AB34J4K7_PRYPA|mmetsp:Transcript_30652/g.46134  ORF Transcript_30652/g.46134 Transcript_30652/m.46134 type:complete len:295 (+) Transcript_30652:1-885(+)
MEISFPRAARPLCAAMRARSSHAIARAVWTQLGPPGVRHASSTSLHAESAGQRRVGAILFSGIVGTTACLGAWQLYRYNWKLQLVDQRHERLSRPPQPLSDVLRSNAAAAELEYSPVHCDGAFVHAEQTLVGPRSAPPGSPQVGPPGAPQPSGFDVVTPFECVGGERILVNRGWVPRDSLAAIEQPAGRVTVRGVLKGGDKPNRFASNDLAGRRCIWLDVESLAAASECAPVLVAEAVDKETFTAGFRAKSWPLAKPMESYETFHVPPSTHLIYTATWWSLTFFGTIMTYKRFR